MPLKASNNPVTLIPSAMSALHKANNRSVDHGRRFLIGHGLHRYWHSFMELEVGSLVTIPRTNYRGVGVVYEIYEIDGRKGASIIMEDGRYDGWSITDWVCVDASIVGSCLLDYTFESSHKLRDDFEAGKFSVGFQRAKEMAG